MKKKIILITLFLALLLPIKTAFGAYSYSRTPSGYTINNPVSFDVSFDSYADFAFPATSSDYWRLEIQGDLGNTDFTCLPTSTLSISQEFNLPLDIYWQVFAQGFSNENCSMDRQDGVYVEEDLEDPGMIFEVVESGGSAGVFFTLPTSTLTDLQAHIGDLVTDTSLLWIIAIALPLGFWMISKVIRIVKSKAK